MERQNIAEAQVARQQMLAMFPIVERRIYWLALDKIAMSSIH